jgi:hypothetical protein
LIRLLYSAEHVEESGQVVPATNWHRPMPGSQKTASPPEQKIAFHWSQLLHELGPEVPEQGGDEEQYELDGTAQYPCPPGGPWQ